MIAVVIPTVLVEAGADITILDSEGKTAKDRAAGFNVIQIIDPTA